jgi:hypothetical protein
MALIKVISVRVLTQSVLGDKGCLRSSLLTKWGDYHAALVPKNSEKQ